MFSEVRPQENYIESFSSRSRKEGGVGTTNLGSDSTNQNKQAVPFAHLGASQSQK